MDGGDGASIDLSIHTYIHIYIYIYIYTQVLVDAPGHEIYCSETAVHPPAAGPRATRPDVPLPRRGAALGVDAGPGGPPPPPGTILAHRQLVNTPACPLHGDRPRERSARPMAYRELASFPGHRCPRTGAAPLPPSRSPAPALDPNPPNLPRPTGPPSHPLDPLDPPLAVGPGGPPARAHGPRAPPHACPLWPSLRRPWSPRGVRGCGGRVQRSPSSSVAVELRPPPRGPVTLPHAGRLIASLIDSPAPVGPPSCAQTLPCPEMISRGEGLCTECGPPGLEHPSQVANWQAHCARAAAGPVPNVGTVTPVEDAGPRPPARRRRQLAARLGARSSNRG